MVSIIIVCIYGGVGTPTEAGSLGAFVILCMALYKGMRWKQLKGALMETAKLTVMIFTIIWGVLLYVRFLGFADLPSAFSDWITSLDQSPMVTLLLILLAYAVLGMFMDSIGMLLLTLPVVYPAVIALNGGENVAGIGLSIQLHQPATRCRVLDDWVVVTLVRMPVRVVGMREHLAFCDGARRCGALREMKLDRSDFVRVGCPLLDLDWLEIL